MRDFRATGLNLLLGFFSLASGIVLAELCFKVFNVEPKLFNGPDAVYSRLFGWEPVIDGINYSDNAINIKKSHLRPEKQRVLFLGDSVVARGLVSDAFAELAGDNKEVLNAGVSGYDTHQEVLLFENKIIKSNPDVVILLFHPNDFDLGVSVMRDPDGGLRVANSYGDFLPVNETLFSHSIVYQFTIQSLLRISALRISRNEAIESDLRRLKLLSKEHNFQLLVVILPWFKWPEEWSETEVKRRGIISGILERSDICYIDAYNVLLAAQGHLPSVQEADGDILHPNSKFAYLLADYIYKQGFSLLTLPALVKESH